MVLNIVVAGVIGYPAKKRHFEATTPQANDYPALARLPCIPGKFDTFR